jgi:hypothetical protein
MSVVHYHASISSVSFASYGCLFLGTNSGPHPSCHSIRKLPRIIIYAFEASKSFIRHQEVTALIKLVLDSKCTCILQLGCSRGRNQLAFQKYCARICPFRPSSAVRNVSLGQAFCGPDLRWRIRKFEGQIIGALI